MPTLDGLHGIHAGGHEPGAVLAHIRELSAAERRAEAAAERLVERDPSREGDE